MNSPGPHFPIPATLCFCVERMQEQGFALSEILEGTGLENVGALSPSTVVSDSQELAVYARIRHLAAGGDIGLNLGNDINTNAVGVLGALVANSRDVSHAGYLMRRFHALSNRWFLPELIGNLTPGTAIVRYRQTTALGPLYRPLIDLGVRGTQQLVVDVYGDAAGAFLREVAFGYPEPEQPERYREAFGCPVSFGHAVTFVTFDNEVGRLPNRRRSEFSFRTYLQSCRDALFRFGDASWQQRVLNILSCMDTYPGTEVIAERLNCSERSLRRHLAGEGVQYSELVDRVRHERAAYLLRHSGASIKEIGYQLDYSEPGAFIRAFSRWTQMTPTQFRERERAGASGLGAQAVAPAPAAGQAG